MCMRWLKYVRLNRKRPVENMGGTTLEVTILADVSGAYSAISSVYQCVTDISLRHSLLDELDSDWSTKR